MNTIGISLYSIGIATRHSPKYLPLGNFKPGEDLFPAIKLILDQHASKALDVQGAAKKIIVGRAKPRGRTIDGMIEVGSYGYGSSLRDVKTGSENYKRKVSDAEMIPLYFFLSLPKEKTRGVLALQYFGDIGAKSGFEELISKSFEATHKDLSFRLRKLTSEKVLEDAIRNSPISKLRFIQHGIASDIADAHGGQPVDPRGGGVEFVVSVRKNVGIGTKVRDRLIEAITGKRQVSDILELDDFEYHEARAEIEIGGRKQTIRLGKPDGMSPRIDISDEVDVDADGHPKPASIRQICADLVADFSSQLP